MLEHTPGRFVRHAGFPFDLFRRNMTARGAHQMNRVKPSPQRSAGLVKDRAGRRMKVMAAMVAGIRPASRRPMMLRNALAHFAKDSIGMQAVAEPLEAGPVVRKHLLKVLGLEVLEYETIHVKGYCVPKPVILPWPLLAIVLHGSI